MCVVRIFIDVYICIRHKYAHHGLILSRITVEKISFSLANKFKEIMDLYNGDTRLKDILSKNPKLMKAIEEK